MVRVAQSSEYNDNYYNMTLGPSSIITLQHKGNKITSEAVHYKEMSTEARPPKLHHHPPRDTPKLHHQLSNMFSKGEYMEYSASVGKK